MPECEHPGNTMFDPPWINVSAPTINGKFADCTRYVVRDNHSDTCSKTSFTNGTRECDSWVYDPYDHTILDEVIFWIKNQRIFSIIHSFPYPQWGFTCDVNRWKLTLVGTIQSSGQFIGLIFAGYISDR